MRRYSWLLGVLGLCACSGSVIDVGPGSVGGAPGGGNNAAGNGSTGGQQGSVPAEVACQDQAPLPTWPSTDACATGSDLPIVGTWHGYVEQQPAPWDDLTLVIRGASVGGGVCGSLTFGSGAIPPPATNPDQDYPDAIAYPISLVPGFPQTLLKGDTDGTRLRFSVSKGEVQRSWCALQDSYDWGTVGACSCMPNWGSMTNGGRTTMQDPTGKHNLSVSFTRMVKCTMAKVCACSAQGCDGAPDLNVINFDLRITANSAQGNDSSHSGERVYFTRVP